MDVTDDELIEGPAKPKYGNMHGTVVSKVLFIGCRSVNQAGKVSKASYGIPLQSDH